jgi:hypothetical protein
MQPRLKTSTKWTSLPKELCQQVRDVFTESFAEAIKSGEIQVLGRIYPQELLLCVGYLEKGRLRPANFEISIDFDANKQNALELIHCAVDCAASMMGEYFAVDGDLTDFPREWQPFKVEGKSVFAQVTTTNTDLEREANRLLGIEKDDLVQESEEEDTEEARKKVITMLGLDKEDDFDDTSTDLQADLDENTSTGIDPTLISDDTRDIEEHKGGAIDDTQEHHVHDDDDKKARSKKPRGGLKH